MSAVDQIAPALQLPTFTRRTSVRSDASVAPRASAALISRKQWERRYRTRLRITDTLIVVMACVGAAVGTILVTAPSLLASDPFLLLRVPLSTAIVWAFAMAVLNTREPAIMGSGATEYARVIHATVIAFGMLAIAYLVFEWQGIRHQLFYALPIGLVVLVMSRWLARRWLITQRAAGRYSSRTVIVGRRDEVEYAIRRLGGDSRLGYDVVGTVLLDGSATDSIRVGDRVYPVVSGEDAAPRAAASMKADTLMVAGQPADDSTYIKRLAWELEGTAADLVLSSRIADVAGPRMSLRPIEGLPLIHVRIPAFEGASYVIKRALDIAVSGLALAAFAPVALIIAIAIKLDNSGPVFFHQERTGRDGKAFKMVKFRSMRVDAEERLQELLDANEGAGPLFKLKEDPRVTRVGKFLRRYSLDEVPQFLNVLRGDMSVVGPRPPLPAEVTAYDGTVFRRLYIKPGITGPWQVGGRSDLTWEESVRLDLRYVENWSVLSDLVIMWKTVKVMIQPEGAY